MRLHEWPDRAGPEVDRWPIIMVYLSVVCNLGSTFQISSALASSYIDADPSEDMCPFHSKSVPNSSVLDEEIRARDSRVVPPGCKSYHSASNGLPNGETPRSDCSLIDSYSLRLYCKGYTANGPKNTFFTH